MFRTRLRPAHFQPRNGAAVLLLLVFLGFIWATLINQLRVEWTLNPQYAYGWAVPFLSAYLVSKECRAAGGFALPSRARFSGCLLVILALIYAPTRLIQVANPDWRLISWALALEVIGTTLLLIYIVLGGMWLRRLAFPVAYFFVAVPWPAFIEQPLIQGLTRADASTTVNLLGWAGIPAIQHGNVIEVATGEVGIDEACSGIRSFQATLMISLFLGGLYRLALARRLGLVFAGFAMAFAFNLIRMSILVWVAARHGVNTISRWHDPTGVTILLVCFFALWAAGAFLAGKKTPASPPASGMPNLKLPRLNHGLVQLLFGLVLWCVFIEISVETWYRWHEKRLPPANQWTILWPTNNPTFKTAALPDQTRQILRYDEGRHAGWETDGVEWQAVFLRWNPGYTALHLVQNHTPEVCMTAAGHAMAIISPQTWFEVDGIPLPFVMYAVKDSPRPFYIFYCLWDDRTSLQGRKRMSLNYGSRLAPVLAGLRNPGQRSLEIALTGDLDEIKAKEMLQTELAAIIRTESNNVPADIK